MRGRMPSDPAPASRLPGWPSGVVMAIPLLLLHSFLQTRSRDLVHILEEETSGIIASQAETAKRSVHS